jgi:hypothetical protein
MLEFRYRYVGFGTNFEQSKACLRPSEFDKADSEFANAKLCRNELALDVGGQCSGLEGDAISVIDHHFSNEPFPSASAAVLHKARLIREKFSSASGFSAIWLVTHAQPDFDAFCSMYLARTIIEASDIAEIEELALDEDRWNEKSAEHLRKINWYDPNLSSYPANIRWMISLASYASRVDHGKRIECPKHRALHSILYAALKRGRDYERQSSGATAFFDEVRTSLHNKGLNPLTDSVLGESSVFRPELELLEEDLKRYLRDIGRARKAIVHLQWHEPSDFHEFFNPLAATPLLTDRLEIRPEHLLERGERRQTDGIYIRDPECLLFKEWARMDLEDSSMGQGFLFTAVAYSTGRPSGKTNQSDYFFSIDPERADGRHLYTLWARLQAAEIRAAYDGAQGGQNFEAPAETEQAKWLAEEAKKPKPTMARPGYEGRAGRFAELFRDPWFDGSNYYCTIVATPNLGTSIAKSGNRADLAGDRIAQIAERELEDAVYASQPPKITLLDLSASDETHGRRGPATHDYELDEVPDVSSGHFRFGRIALKHEKLDLQSGDLARQVGTVLWRILHPKSEEGLPLDLVARHVFTTRDWMGVWSRTGVIIAYKPGDGERDAHDAQRRFTQIIELARSVQRRFSSGTDYRHIERRMEDADELTRRAAELRYQLILPENRLLSQFFDAINIGELLQTMRDMLLGLNTHTTAEVQTKVEWLEIFLVGFYGTELARSVVEQLDLQHLWGEDIGQPVGLFIIVTAGALFTGLTAWLLKPWHYRRSKSLIWLLVLAFAVYVASILVAVLRYPSISELMWSALRSIYP